MNEVIVYNGVRFNRDKKTGYYLSSRKINGKRKRLHRFVWESHNGEIPNGFHIHHKNHDKSDNRIENLELIGSKKHLEHHGQHPSKKLIEHRKNNLDRIRPLTKKWHRSEDGRKQHREQALKTWEKQKKLKIEMKCEQCGEAYTTYQSRAKTSKFCGNNCKSKFRRSQKIDFIQMTCPVCGAVFEKNKYEKRKTCSKSCGIKLSWVARKQS